MRLVSLIVGLVATCALAAASFAPAKEGARARLTTRLPLTAAPGTTVRAAWTVEVSDGNGRRRPFSASGMFVRLLSRTNAAPTLAFAGQASSGRYLAEVKVPEGGIGGVRIGLRGSDDLVFPLANDPFTSPGGARCDVAALTATLARFVSAYNGGSLARLESLFSKRPRFVWYSSGEPGVRLGGEASKRKTLMAYFKGRHGRGDRLRVLTHRFNGYDSQRRLGHFEFRAERRADDFQDGRWFSLGGKGALDCSKPPIKIAVMSIGGPGG